MSTISQDVPSSCDDLYHCRTIWDIIWSCLTTIFACTWMAIHPNIPSPYDTPFVIIIRQVKLMVLALIAPELVVIWAMRQRLVAGRLANEYLSYGWTRAHGFFAIMGGFMLVKSNEPDHVILPDSKELGDYLKSGEINVTEDEVNDRSKRDALSKAFVLVQTGWFILQCIARGVQHMPVTELEILSLAFAALNFVTYGLWWDKPYGVGCSIPVKRVEPSEESHHGGICSDIKDTFGGIWRTITSWPTNCGSVFNRVGTISLRQVGAAIAAAGSYIFVAVPLSFFSPFLQMAGFGEDGDPYRVGTFYAGKLEPGEGRLVSFVSAGVASVFGAIHCVAWSFHFPSPVEQILWRVCSVAITSLPGLVIATRTAAKAIENARKKMVDPQQEAQMEQERIARQVPDRVLQPVITFATIADVILVSIGYCQVVLYVLCRVILLVLACISLRSLEYGAFQTGAWTFIPHV